MPVTALAASTQIMVFNTTSAMTLVAADGLGDRSGADRAQALFALALVCGIFQLALGILGLGFLTKFVSNAVMTGFLTGIAVLIILGQLWDLTGYEGEGVDPNYRKPLISLLT
jgi:SulP family sulfate permease